MKFLVLMACHNRKALTLNLVQRAQLAADAASVAVEFTVFDDGSTDGTTNALAQLSSNIRVLSGDGSAYWARGMASAEAAAIEGRCPVHDEFLVWLNDDVNLDLDAFCRIKESLVQFPDSILVGAMRHPVTQGITYSGLKRRGLHPLSFERVFPTVIPQQLDTFNGNLVVVPTQVGRTLGGIDGYFSHALADIDYGLRAARLGVPALLLSGTFGECSDNAPSPRGTARQDWLSFIGPKGGGNLMSLKRILRKGRPRTWPLYIVITYVLWWIRRANVTLGSVVGRS